MKKIITPIIYLLCIAYIVPFCTIYIFDVFNFQKHSIFKYLDITYIYPTLFSKQKYMIVAFCLSMLAFFLLTRKLAILDNNNEHGSSRWITNDELNNFFCKRTLSKDGIHHGKKSFGGILVRKLGLSIWHEVEALHSIVIGTTGSGKTRKVLIPSIMISSQAEHTHKKVLKIKILSKEEYIRYLNKKKQKERSKFWNHKVVYQVLFMFHKVINKVKILFNLCEVDTLIVSINSIIDLRKKLYLERMKDIKIDYSFHKDLIKIDTQDILTTLKKGKVKLKVSYTVYGDSFLVNDTKKELYRTYKNYLEENGYRVILIDMRKNWIGDCWNPMQSVIRSLEQGKKEEADMYAKDIAATLCPDSKLSEKIWTDGERAIISAVILAVADSDCPEEQKNLYSCYQILSTLGQPDTNDHVKLNDYFNSLELGNVARTAFGPAVLATDRTRMSFYVSAAATLGLFSSALVAKQTARSTFDITSLAYEKTAVFLVNPDEKNNMDPLASLFVDEIYRVLSLEANKSKGQLVRRFHNYLDEFGNMGKQNSFAKRLSVSRGKNILYHLFIQDFGQLEEVYGKDVSNIIKANCNLLIYISTQNLETAKEVSEKIGNKTIVTTSVNESTNESIFLNPHGNITKSLMPKPLFNANELMQLEEGKAVVLRIRMYPMLTHLEDCSFYDFYQNLKPSNDEPIRSDIPLTAYIPEVKETYDFIGEFNTFK